MNFRPLLLAASFLFIAPAWPQTPAPPQTPAAPRPEKWAQRLDTEGLSNLHRVTPAIFRSAQPTADGLRAAERLGIRTVLSLRDDAGDEPFATGTKLRLVRVPMQLSAPNEDALLRAVAILAASADGPILVHCQLGADRTGAVCALYRVLVQDWPREEALRELREGGFGFGLEEFARYLATADLPRLRRVLAERISQEAKPK